MALTSMPYLTIQELDANGAPYAGAKMFFYAAGTSTKQDTYSDANGVSANTNPVILDASGRATIFFQPLTYDVVLAPSTDSDPPVSPIWTRSGIAAVPLSSSNLDIAGTAGQALAAGDAVILSEGSGGNTAGRWYKADADQTYLSTLAPQIGMVQDAIASGASGSIRVGGRITGLSGLTAGSLYYISGTAGSITTSAPSNAMPIAVADSTTSVVLCPPTPWASATVPGLVSIGSQTFAGAKTFTGLAAFSANATFVGNPIFAPGTLALGSMDATIAGCFHKGVTATGSSTGGTIKLTGDITVKGNTLTADGKSLRFRTCCVTAANANNKRIRAYYGGTTVFDTGVFTGPGTAQMLSFDVSIVRTGASAQKIHAVWGSGTTVGSAYGFIGNRTVGALDNTSDQIFKVEADTAVANDDVVHDFTLGEVVG